MSLRFAPRLAVALIGALGPVVDGAVTRIRVSAKAIRMGVIVKPPKRDWKPAEPAKVDGKVPATAPVAVKKDEAAKSTVPAASPAPVVKK